MSDEGDREAIRQDLERFWDAKLRNARRRYYRAAAEFHRTLLAYPGDPKIDPYWSAGIRRAEAEAFADYCRVLATFTELVAIGTLQETERRAC